MEGTENKKHIVCFSGGHSSSLVAIEIVRKFNNNNVVLLNHDINPSKEHKDIKRFKSEIANYLKLPITYANIGGIINPEEIPDQFDVVMLAKAFKVGGGSELCTSRLKTNPFYKWLNDNGIPGQDVIYYGFDKSEMHRVVRRRKILDSLGYESVYPLAEWERTIKNTTEIGIAPPFTYDKFKHANCIGCLKAGKQHWYVVYCTRRDVWDKAKTTESYIGYTIHPEESLESLEPLFESMKMAGIEASEHIPSQKFWGLVNRIVKPKTLKDGNIQGTIFMPCECVV